MNGAITGLMIRAARPFSPTPRAGPADTGTRLGAASLAGKAVASVDPVPIPGQVGGADVHVRGFEGRAHATPPREIENRNCEGAKIVARLKEAIETDRETENVEAGKLKGELSKEGLLLKGLLGWVSRSYELLAGGPAVGEALVGRVHELEDQLHALTTMKTTMERHGLGSVERGSLKVPEGVQEDMKNILENAETQLRDRVAYLKDTLANTPCLASNLLRAKAVVCEGAIQVVDKALGRATSDVQREKLDQAKQTLMERKRILEFDANDLDKKQNAPASGTAGSGGYVFVELADLLGKQRLSPLHPSRPAQTRALEGYVDTLAQGRQITVHTPEITEECIVEAYLNRVLDESGVFERKDTGVLGRIKATGARLFSAAKSFVAQQLPHAVASVYNGRDWKTIERGIQVQSGNQAVKLTSRIRPGAHFFDSYGGKGVNSHSTTEYRHAANLSQTELLDGQKKPMFSAVRHGVLSAYGITTNEVRHMDNADLSAMIDKLLDGQTLAKHGVPEGADDAAKRKAVREKPALVAAMRRQANLNRADEVVAAHVAADKDLVKKAIETAKTGEAVSIDILSVSLLTPDWFRKGTQSNERRMLAEQRQAWADVGAKEREVEVRNPDTNAAVKVKVKVNPVAMNYGVNAGAVAFGTDKPVLKYGNRLLDPISGWEASDGMNHAALGALSGGVSAVDLASGKRPDGVLGRKLAELEEKIEKTLGTPDGEAAQSKLALARELMVQIGEIERDGSYRAAGSEPYKMPARLAVLGDLLGIKVAFNCKSGKDRTGELDAEAKFLRYRMEATGHVPHYNRVRTAEEKAQFYEFLRNGGNYEVQRQNTGEAGYRLRGVDALYQEFAGEGDDDLIAGFLGASGYTPS